MWAHLAAWDAQLAGDLVPVCWRQILLVNESLLKLKDLGVGEGGSGFPLLLCITFFPQLDLVWRWNELLICLVNLCSGWWGDHWFGVQSRHPPTLITGRCHWSQVTIGQSEDMVVTWMTNKKLRLLRTYHYPGLVIVPCHIGQLLSSEVKQKLIKMPGSRIVMIPLISCELCAVDDKWARRAPV